MENKIIIRGAKTHNLKNINLDIPRNKLVVITGISGSGKSSLAFDTIYAEGQRRYIESLSSYARQFLGTMDKPDVDLIDGLSPAISIDQKSASHNPRSTVGTITEIYDYLRVFYARVGKPFCPNDNTPIVKQTIDQIIDFVADLLNNKKIIILSPIVIGRKGEYHQLLNDLYQDGYLRVRINGKFVDLNQKIELGRYKTQNIDAVITETTVNLENRKILAESIEQALHLSDHLVIIHNLETGEDFTFSEELSCPTCGFSYSEISPRLFSFNSPFGACPTCQGLGVKREIDADLIMPDHNKTIDQGGIVPWSFNKNGYLTAILKAVCEHHQIPTNVRIKDLKKEQFDIILNGSNEKIKIHHRTATGSHVFNLNWKGIVRMLEDRYKQTESDAVRLEIEKYFSVNNCPDCQGARLKKESLSIKVNGINISELTSKSVKDAYDFFHNLPLTDREKTIIGQVLKEIMNRLEFLMNVGLDYLSLDRMGLTLAGGEAQRIRLASQLGSKLMGVLYILDEPSIGLHQRDNLKLINTLKYLRELGNTVIVVEHDEETIRTADYIVDIGPGAGEHGGNVVASGSLNEILESPESFTGQYLRGEKKIIVPKKRRAPKDFIEIRGAREHNLKNINSFIPLGVFTCVTGVSGSGKSTLINDILYKGLAFKIMRHLEKPGEHKDIIGAEKIDKILIIDQSPIGRTPRSNPATYTKTFDIIREIFSMTKEARERGYRPGRFSFNVTGGRCENCNGDGLIKIEMHFLPDVYVPCEVCNGSRYNHETLEVKYKGKNISDVLNMTVEEALKFFSPIKKIADKLQTLMDVGLGYIKLGQSATTLSGGEAQRIKLASELAKPATGNTFYILDEPTTGLHFDDINKLLLVLNRLVDAGNSILVIEHNLDVIKSADFIIDLGPEGGDKGGKIVATGTPENIAGVEKSFTGQYLREVLNF
ncbi:MAG: excinuclease ABC subunit UvrA [Patescibacteria group bacterium]|jgi:excinuclease ABC subunit A